MRTSPRRRTPIALARRAARPSVGSHRANAYMFTFNGERHGLRSRDNMKYWTVHMDEFFDHYLLGKARPEWMDKGVSYQDRGKRDVAPLFKTKSPASTTTEQQERR